MSRLVKCSPTRSGPLKDLSSAARLLAMKKKLAEYRGRLVVIEDLLANRKKEIEEVLEKETGEDTD